MDSKDITSICYCIDGMNINAELYLPRCYLWFERHDKNGSYGYVPVCKVVNAVDCGEEADCLCCQKTDPEMIKRDEEGNRIFEEHGEKLAAAFKEFCEKVGIILKDIEV
jgi:hypothetical protein